MLTPLLIGLAVIVVLLLIIVATRPSDFRVTRSNAIAAPAEIIFAQVNDLHKWEAWSPWEKIDPALKKTFAGPPAGTGASYSWVGNNKVGSGRMTIMESHPGERIRIKLEFLKPFKATNTAEFVFQPDGNQTAVTWSMSGKNNFMSKAMGLIMNFDKMIGSQFEKGLAQMKLLAETATGR
jgi:hypothetical protein